MPARPTLMILIALGLPMTTGYTCYMAGHLWPAVATGVIMPFIAIFAYLLTPMTPPEDPDEPKPFSLDDLQQYTPGCVQGCLDALGTHARAPTLD